MNGCKIPLIENDLENVKIGRPVAVDSAGEAIGKLNMEPWNGLIRSPTFQRHFPGIKL